MKNPHFKRVFAGFSPAFHPPETVRPTNSFPSPCTSAAALSGGPAGSAPARAAVVMDARRPDCHTVPSTVPVLRANEFPLRAGEAFAVFETPLWFFAWLPAGPIFRSGSKRAGRCPIRLIKWRLVVVVDMRWEFCPGFLLAPDRYAARSVATLMGRVMTEIAQPNLWYLSSWLWQNRTLRCAMRRCPVPTQPSHDPKVKATVASFVDRLRQPAVVIPGYHDDMDDDHRCQSSLVNPREHYLSLETVLARLAACIQFANTEPVTSPMGWGCWIPWERFGQELKEHPPTKLDAKYQLYAGYEHIRLFDAGLNYHLN